jgi:spore coat protein A
MALPVGTVSPTKPIGPIMQFRLAPAANPVNDPSVVPGTLRGPALPTGEDARRRITLDEIMGPGGKPVAALLNNTHFMHMANGGVMAPTETPNLNATEVWEFINLTEDTHPIHMHLVHFEVLDRQAFNTAAYQTTLNTARQIDPGAVLDPGPYLADTPQPAPADERCAKDTVRVNPDQVTRIRATFDRAGRYIYHCHILEHEENEMMRPFKVA